MPKKLTKYHKLRKKLAQRREQVRKEFEKKQVKAVKWLADRNLSLPAVYQTTTRLLTTGTLAGTMLLSGNVQPPQSLPASAQEEQKLKAQIDSAQFRQEFSRKLKALIPAEIGKFGQEKQKQICELLEDYFNFPACFNLEGNELNFFYAWIGYEQHLYRYPEDSLDQHDDELVAGIAPGLGAYGYFAASKEEMSQKDYLREKYYVAVQTLYLPEWQIDWERVYNWYRYRKVVVVNPENGRACVAVVGDAGPADWTGKQFGGSPEVMKELDLHLEWQKGQVLLLFVKDPKDRVPLGPVEIYPVPKLDRK